MTEPTSPRFLDLHGHFGTSWGSTVDLSDKKNNESRFWAEELRSFRPSGDEHGNPESTVTDAEAAPGSLRCLQCGELVEFRLDQDAIRIVEYCVETGGIKPYDIYLDIPSGAIVFSKDLRNLVIVDNHDRAGNDMGTRRFLTQSAADAGLAMIDVDSDRLYVVREGNEFALMSGSDAEAEGYIETERDRYSAMDRRLFEERRAAIGYDIDGTDYFIVAVPPGVYAFSDELASRGPGAVVYSRIRQVDVEPPVLRVEGADTATTLAESRFAKLFEDRDAAELVRAFTDSAVHLPWINGCLRRLSGFHSATPYGSLEGRVGVGIDARVPALPAYQPDWLYPLRWDFPAAMGDIPVDANIYYLAAGMMVIKAALSNPIQCFKPTRDWPKEKADERNEEIRRALVAILDLDCELAASRGLWNDGSLEKAFAEVNEWFSGGPATPRPPRLLARV